MPASSDCAPASSRRRVPGSDNAAMRSSSGSANTSRHPGSPSRMAPCSKLSRSCMVWGSVSATTVAPRAAAAVPAASWFQAASGFMADTPSTFQLTGRSARSDIVARKSISSSVKPLRQPGTISSTVVPSCSRTAAARRSISSRPAARDGTGCPSPSLCVCTWEVENPSAPSARAACNAASMASRSAALAAPPTARSPMTSRRSVECPTRKPALTAMRPSRWPSHSPKEVQSQGRPARSAASGMPSTRAIIREM